jgi:hypothetical protein
MPSQDHPLLQLILPCAYDIRVRIRGLNGELTLLANVFPHSGVEPWPSVSLPVSVGKLMIFRRPRSWRVRHVHLRFGCVHQTPVPQSPHGGLVFPLWLPLYIPVLDCPQVGLTLSSGSSSMVIPAFFALALGQSHSWDCAFFPLLCIIRTHVLVEAPPAGIASSNSVSLVLFMAVFTNQGACF